jgi:hypothetical protein
MPFLFLISLAFPSSFLISPASPSLRSPRIGNSVGESNYAFFLLFVLSALALSVLVATGSALHIKQLATGSAAGWVDSSSGHATAAGKDAVATSSHPSAAPSRVSWIAAAGHSPLFCALLALCALSTTLLTLLLAYHVYLVSINQTTYENVSPLPLHLRAVPIHVPSPLTLLLAYHVYLVSINQTTYEVVSTLHLHFRAASNHVSSPLTLLLATMSYLISVKGRPIRT